MSVLLKSNGLILYAVCWEYIVRGKIEHNDIDYVHAKSAHDAKLQFFRGKRYTWRFNIVACAPAVGVHAQDDNGDKLAV